jgi:hypothetical protein
MENIRQVTKTIYNIQYIYIYIYIKGTLLTVTRINNTQSIIRFFEPA